MRMVFVLLVIALFAATTSLAAPTRLSGVRNINNGIALLPTLNLAGRAAAAVNAAVFDQPSSFNYDMPDFNLMNAVLETR